MLKNSWFLFLLALSVSACDSAKLGYAPYTPSFQTQSLMTSQDTYNSTYSNVSITNGTNSTIVSSGVFVASYDVNDCSACFGAVVSGDNSMGAMVEPISFGSGQTIQIGQNYLYNIIYNGISTIRNIAGSSPCALPGCSWSGDASIQGWCLSLNMMSRHSPYTQSNYVNGTNPPANVIPMAAAGNSLAFNYKFDLINPSTLGTGQACIGLVTCNDKTLTCKVNSPQNQKFMAY